MEFITDRTLADVTQKTDKGKYSYKDFNRIAEQIRAVSELLNRLGYEHQINYTKTFTASDLPTLATTNKMLICIRNLQQLYINIPNTPKIPNDMVYMDYLKANDIEKVLSDLWNCTYGTLTNFPVLGEYELGG